MVGSRSTAADGDLGSLPEAELNEALEQLTGVRGCWIALQPLRHTKVCMYPPNRCILPTASVAHPHVRGSHAALISTSPRCQTQLEELCLRWTGQRGLPPAVASLSRLRRMAYAANSALARLPAGPWQQSLRSLDLAGVDGLHLG